MYSVLNTLSEYTYFYISKNITSYTFLLVFTIVENLQYILKERFIYVASRLKLKHCPNSSNKCNTLDELIERFKFDLSVLKRKENFESFGQLQQMK